MINLYLQRLDMTIPLACSDIQLEDNQWLACLNTYFSHKYLGVMFHVTFGKPNLTDPFYQQSLIYDECHKKLYCIFHHVLSELNLAKNTLPDFILFIKSLLSNQKTIYLYPKDLKLILVFCDSTSIDLFKQSRRPARLAQSLFLKIYYDYRGYFHKFSDEAYIELLWQAFHGNSDDLSFALTKVQYAVLTLITISAGHFHLVDNDLPFLPLLQDLAAHDCLLPIQYLFYQYPNLEYNKALIGSVFKTAGMHGRLEIMHYLYLAFNQICSPFWEEIIDEAISNKYLHIIEYCIAQNVIDQETQFALLQLASLYGWQKIFSQLMVALLQDKSNDFKFKHAIWKGFVLAAVHEHHAILTTLFTMLPNTLPWLQKQMQRLVADNSQAADLIERIEKNLWVSQKSFTPVYDGKTQSQTNRRQNYSSDNKARPSV